MDALVGRYSCSISLVRTLGSRVRLGCLVGYTVLAEFSTLLIFLSCWFMQPFVQLISFFSVWIAVTFSILPSFGQCLCYPGCWSPTCAFCRTWLRLDCCSHGLVALVFLPNRIYCYYPSIMSSNLSAKISWYGSPPTYGGSLIWPEIENVLFPGGDTRRLFQLVGIEE